MSVIDSERRSRFSIEKERLSQTTTEDVEQTFVGPDVAVIKFLPEDEEALNIRKGIHLTIDRPWKTVAKSVILEIFERMEKIRYIKRLKSYNYEEVLVGYQATLAPTDGHLVCLTEKGRSKVLGELAQLHSTLSEKVRRYLIRTSLRPPLPERLVPSVKKERPPIVYEWEGLIEPRHNKIHFSSSKVLCYTRILCRNKEKITLVESAVQHAEVLATPTLKDCTVQTEPEITINDCTQFIPEVDLPSFIKLTNDEEANLAKVCSHYKDTVLEATSYNTLFDLYKDDYSELLEMGTPLTLPKSGNYCHFMSFNDLSQFEGKIVTALSWHPKISGAVAVAYGTDSTNNTVRLESDSEDENYCSRGEELEIWAKTRKVVSTVEDQDTAERDSWMRSVKRLDQVVSHDYNEDQWAASEVLLDTIESAMLIRDYEVNAQKSSEEVIPFFDASPEEYDMYYVPYGTNIDVNQKKVKHFITDQIIS